MRQHLLLYSSLILFFLSGSSAILSAQHQHDSHDHHPEENNHNHIHGSEIGFAIGAVALHDELKPGFHLHYLRPFPGNDHIRYGIGGEVVLDEHTHLTASAMLNFTLWRGLQFSLAPGILFLNHEEEWEKHFSTHLELFYEFEIKGIHIGPLLDYSISSAENHYMAGIHVGFQLN
ncbi:MAG: hypothetical protein ACOC0C_05730 [Bacteroidota bacterium]